MIYKYKKEKIYTKKGKLERGKKMKKTFAIFAIVAILITLFTFTTKVYATQAAIDNGTESKLVQIKETQTKSLQDYQEKWLWSIWISCIYIKFN